MGGVGDTGQTNTSVLIRSYGSVLFLRSREDSPPIGFPPPNPSDKKFNWRPVLSAFSAHTAENADQWSMRAVDQLTRSIAPLQFTDPLLFWTFFLSVQSLRDSIPQEMVFIQSAGVTLC